MINEVRKKISGVPEEIIANKKALLNVFKDDKLRRFSKETNQLIEDVV